MVPNDTSPDRVELWVQPLPDGDLRPLVDGLRAVRRRGSVAAVGVRRWDRYVDADGPETSPTWRHLGRFLRYAGPDGDFAPAVTVGTGRMGPARRVRRVPVAALAEYRDGRLVRLTPCDGDPACVLRRLDELAARPPVRTPTHRGPASDPSTAVPSALGRTLRPPGESAVRSVPT
jgi:hypothetical protein